MTSVATVVVHCLSAPLYLMAVVRWIRQYTAYLFGGKSTGMQEPGLPGAFLKKPGEPPAVAPRSHGMDHIVPMRRVDVHVRIDQVVADAAFMQLRLYAQRSPAAPDPRPGIVLNETLLAQQALACQRTSDLFGVLLGVALGAQLDAQLPDGVLAARQEPQRRRPDAFPSLSLASPQPAAPPVRDPPPRVLPTL